LFGDSLVCVDRPTSGNASRSFTIPSGTDLSSAPILADITVNGRHQAVARRRRKRSVNVRRLTGQPVWPLKPRAKRRPGEWCTATQPFPTKPPAAYAGRDRDLIDFTPGTRAGGKASALQTGPMFVPPVVSVAGGPLRPTIGMAADQLAGRRIRPETHVVFAASNASIAPIGLVEPPKEFGSDLRYVMGTAGQPFVEREGPGFGSAADAPQRRPVPIPAPASGGAAAGRGAAAAGATANPLVVQGLSLVQPPYGLLSAINFDRGEMVWQVPHGGHDAVESSRSQGDEHSENGTEWRCRARCHQVAGHHGRSAGHHDA
jgi:quinoprotein glucose dehydrogenase